MRTIFPLIALAFVLAACAPEEEGTPLPTRTENSSEGGFGGLNAEKQKKVPDKPEQYDVKSLDLFGLTPYPQANLDTATTELYSSQDKSNLTVKFQASDPVDTVATFYAAQLDGGSATPQKAGESTLVNGESKTKATVSVSISTAEGVTKVTIQATKVTQYEVE